MAKSLRLVALIAVSALNEARPAGPTFGHVPGRRHQTRARRGSSAGRGSRRVALAHRSPGLRTSASSVESRAQSSRGSPSQDRAKAVSRIDVNKVRNGSVVSSIAGECCCLASRKQTLNRRKRSQRRVRAPTETAARQCKEKIGRCPFIALSKLAISLAGPKKTFNHGRHGTHGKNAARKINTGQWDRSAKCAPGRGPDRRSRARTERGGTGQENDRPRPARN